MSEEGQEQRFSHSSMSHPRHEEHEDFTLGVSLYDQKRYIEAAELLRNALQRRQRALVENHEEIQHCKFWLGRAFYKQGMYGEASWLLKQAVHGRGYRSNEDVQRTLEYTFWLGRAALEQKDYFEATLALEEVARRWEDIYPDPDDLRKLKSKFWYGKTLYCDGSYRVATTGQEKTLGPSHAYTLQCKSYYAFTLDKLKKSGDAHEQLRKVKDGLQESQDLNEEWMREAIQLLSEYEQSQLQSSSPSSDNIGDNIGDHRPVNLLDRILFFGDPSTRQSFTDAQIQKIAKLLKLSQPQWSKHPRTYMVLRMIGQLEVIDRLISYGFSDYLFPLTKATVPRCLEPNVRVALLQAQRLVLNNSTSLEKGKDGAHCHFGNEDDLPFDELCHLGKGAYGEVHLIRGHASLKEYARKRIIRRLASNISLNEFVAEIQILKRLEHHHVVRFVGSYTDPMYIGIVMSPVAQMDLDTYLREARRSHHSNLQSYFGCLATALEFLHSKKIRHKDIKPSNILVQHGGNVLFTDFGLSYDFTDANGSTTMNMTGGTRRYCAPEIVHREPANTKSDIWSLGVVFVEMIITLVEGKREDIDAFFEGRGSHRTFISENIDALPDFIAELKSMRKLSDDRPLEWVRGMLTVEKASRPTATSLVETITAGSSDKERRNFCCDACLWPVDDSSDDSN
jgi:tRNA A-37 threonylcarbamoyl transferase component Bud32/predicted RNA-binding Zn ribbon-like protein